MNSKKNLSDFLFYLRKDDINEEKSKEMRLKDRQIKTVMNHSLTINLYYRYF